MDHKEAIESMIGEESFYMVEMRMESFLKKAHKLKMDELEYLMAAYAYSGKNRKDLREKYPGVEAVEDNLNNINQFVGKHYLPKHCFSFAKQYQDMISVASEPVREQFYRIFPLRWECKAEHDMFTASKRGVKYVDSCPAVANRDEIIAENERVMVDKLASCRGNYVIIAGTGVSAQLVENVDRSFKAVSNWEVLVGLLRTDIEEFLGETLTTYFERWYPREKDKDLDPMVRGHMLHSMIKVYNLFHGTDIDYTRFISRLFHAVKPRNPVPDLAMSLGSRNVPLATTNYDTLLETCLHRFEYNLSEQCTHSTDCEAHLQKEAAKINPRNYPHHVYHLHGVWHSRAEMTLGVEYAHSDEAFKNSLRVLTHNHDTSVHMAKTRSGSKKRSFDTFSARNEVFSSKPVVFVGTKAGVFDPHFLPWIRSSTTTHFILMRDAEFDNMEATIAAARLTGKLIPVVYGAKYEDLAEFVARVLPVRVID